MVPAKYIDSTKKDAKKDAKKNATDLLKGSLNKLRLKLLWLELANLTQALRTYLARPTYMAAQAA